MTKRRGSNWTTYCRVGTIPCTPGMISSLSTAFPLSVTLSCPLLDSPPPFTSAPPPPAWPLIPLLPCCCCPGSEMGAPVEDAREVEAVGRTNPDMFNRELGRLDREWTGWGVICGCARGWRTGTGKAGRRCKRIERGGKSEKCKRGIRNLLSLTSHSNPSFRSPITTKSSVRLANSAITQRSASSLRRSRFVSRRFSLEYLSQDSLRRATSALSRKATSSGLNRAHASFPGARRSD